MLPPVTQLPRRHLISCWEWKLEALVSKPLLPPEESELTVTYADLIELGMPFTDPIADGPTIQRSNTVRSHSFVLDNVLNRPHGLLV
jgi:hypothetical protein